MGIESHLNKKVMIVDDLPNMRTDLSRILKHMGFTKITEKQDGKVAWDELRDQAQYGKPYEIIFSDINMPQMNGLTLLKTLRAADSYKKVPIFMVSTENEKDIIVKAILDGATDYILKPFTEKIVIEKLISRLK